MLYQKIKGCGRKILKLKAPFKIKLNGVGIKNKRSSLQKTIEFQTTLLFHSREHFSYSFAFTQNKYLSYWVVKTKTRFVVIKLALYWYYFCFYFLLFEKYTRVKETIGYRTGNKLTLVFIGFIPITILNILQQKFHYCAVLLYTFV